MDCYDSHGHRHKQLVRLQQLNHIYTQKYVLHCLHSTTQHVPGGAQCCAGCRLLARHKLAFRPLHNAAAPFAPPLPALLRCPTHAACRRHVELSAHQADTLQVKSGNDDLRQDAVMQQFFELINRVLAGSASSASRKLRIATYKVWHQAAAPG